MEEIKVEKLKHSTDKSEKENVKTVLDYLRVALKYSESVLDDYKGCDTNLTFMWLRYNEILKDLLICNELFEKNKDNLEPNPDILFKGLSKDEE